MALTPTPNGPPMEYAPGVAHEPLFSPEQVRQLEESQMSAPQIYGSPLPKEESKVEVVMVEEAVERPAFLAEEEEVKLQVSTTTGTPSPMPKVTAADAFQVQMIQLMHALRQDNLRLREEQLKMREGMMEQQKIIKHAETIRDFDGDGIFKTPESDEKEGLVQCPMVEVLHSRRLRRQPEAVLKTATCSDRWIASLR